MMPERNENTVKILAMPSTMTNREVADALDLDIDTVKNARKNHGVEYARNPRDRGYKTQILARSFDTPASVLAKEIGCTVRYLLAVRQAHRNLK